MEFGLNMRGRVATVKKRGKTSKFDRISRFHRINLVYSSQKKILFNPKILSTFFLLVWLRPFHVIEFLLKDVDAQFDFLLSRIVIF